MNIAASIPYWSQALPQIMALEKLSKKMIEYIQHAWNEDEEAYEAILQVCKDYEEEKLFFNKEHKD